MIFGKPIPTDELEKHLDKASDVISIISCQACARGSGYSGPEQMKDLALKLRADGYNVKEGFMVLYSCTPKALFAKLDKEVNTVISVSCRAGTDNIARLFSNIKAIGSAQDVGLVVGSTRKGLLKVTMPFADFKEEKGKEFGMGVGDKKDTHNELLGGGEK